MGFDIEGFPDLREELGVLFRAGMRAELPEERFNELALRVFRFQLRESDLYARFCRGRGIDAGALTRWEDIPPVPTRAFRRFRFVSGLPDRVEAVFRTSGTTATGGVRGEHHVRSLALYRDAVLANFASHVLPDRASLPLVSLIPSAADVPDSSLSRMATIVESEFAAEGGGWFADPETGIRVGDLRTALTGFQDRGRPVLLMATAFALVHWLDAMDERGWKLTLPKGSRIMETGGFKGRSRAMDRSELYGAIQERTGVPIRCIVNEYGMTELLSQFYEPVLAEGSDTELSERRHVAPPWVRTRILDPETLEPVERGRPGILHHLDLANLGSVASVLTEDFGTAWKDGFRVLGRAPGAEPRGCSLGMEELIDLAAGGPESRRGNVR